VQRVRFFALIVVPLAGAPNTPTMGHPWADVAPMCLKSHGQLALDLGALRTDTAAADIVLVVPDAGGRGQVEVRAHSLILKARSEFFRTALGSGMVESVERRVELPDLPSDVLDRFLEYIYTGTARLTPIIALHLYNAGDKFLMEDLKRLCLHYLWGFLDNTNIVELLCRAYAMGTEPKLLNLLLSYAAGHIGEISQEDFNGLPGDLVVSLLQYGSLSAREADILTLVCSWAATAVERDLAAMSARRLQSAWRRRPLRRSPGPSNPEAPEGPGCTVQRPEDSSNGCPARKPSEESRGTTGSPVDNHCPGRSPGPPPCVAVTFASGDDGEAVGDVEWPSGLPNAIQAAMSAPLEMGESPTDSPRDSTLDEGSRGEVGPAPAPTTESPAHRLRQRKLEMLRELLAPPLRYIRFSLINQKDLSRLAEESKIRIITDAATDPQCPMDVVSGGRRAASSVVHLQIPLTRDRTERNFEYNAFKFKVVLVKSDTQLGVYLHFQYYTYPQLFVINARGISLSLLSFLPEGRRKKRTLDDKMGLGRFGLGYKAFLTAAEFPEYISPTSEVHLEVDFPFYNGRKLHLCPHDDAGTLASSSLAARPI